MVEINVLRGLDEWVERLSEEQVPARAEENPISWDELRDSEIDNILPRGCGNYMFPSPSKLKLSQ